MNQWSDTARIELLLPSEIRRALAARSVVYVPLGTYEWHGEHLPIGLDALTAHGLCLAAARLDGGLVLPPLYYGTGGGHGHYLWTIMVPEAELASILTTTLRRLADFGVATVVLLSGHFAGEQVATIERLERDWSVLGHAMRIKALSVAGARHLTMKPDHAALFETTLLGAIWPDRVRLDLLPPLATTPSADPGGDEMGPQRHNPDHPLFGIFGPDPRVYDPATAPDLFVDMVDWLIGQVRSLSERSHA